MNHNSRSQVVVYVRRGLVEEVIASRDDLDVMVVDYDNEKMSERMERAFEPIRCDDDRISRSIDGTELQ